MGYCDLKWSTPAGRLFWILWPNSSGIFLTAHAALNEDLAQAAGRALDRAVHQEEVFSALDFLADAGLLEERVAPPVAEGKVSRRSLLVQMAPVVSAAAWMMSGASARAGGLLPYGESDRKESNNKESNNKESNNKANTREENSKYDNKQIDKEYNDKRTDTDVMNKERDIKNRLDPDGESTDESTSREHNNKERDRVWYDQHRGRIDLTGKYAVAPNHPLLGKWTRVAGKGEVLVLGDTHIKVTAHRTFSSRGILESQVSSISYNVKERYNWKYTSTGPRTGVLEIFLGELEGRGDIRWISRNEYEYTVTFQHDHPEVIGHRLRYVRDY